MTQPQRSAKDVPTKPKLRAVGAVIEEAEDRGIESAIHRLKGSFLECRTIGHAWKIVYVGPSRGYDEELATRARHHPWSPDGARILRCGRCRTERVDLCLVGYGRREYAFQMVSRYYRYPDDYKVEGANQHRDWLHEELFKRALGEE